MLVLMGGRPQGLFWFWREAEKGGGGRGAGRTSRTQAADACGRGEDGGEIKEGKIRQRGRRRRGRTYVPDSPSTKRSCGNLFMDLVTSL